MKRFFGIAIVLALVLSSCNVVGSIINPLIGTWSNTTLLIVTVETFNGDGSFTHSVAGVTTTGKWTSNGTSWTQTYSDGGVVTRYYILSNDNKDAVFSLTQGGIGLTFTRQ